MSGHSKWSTIKHKKAATDAVRGKLFSKFSRAISVAVKTGGGGDLDSNHKLRMVVDKAKSVNMPKDRIENAIKRASSEGENLDEIVYEGFGPNGIAVMVEVATDNRNRAAQEIKSIFEKGGGSLGGPGSVSFNFTPKGLLLVKGQGNVEEQMLKLIDLGVEDIEEVEGDLEIYVSPDILSETRKKLEADGYKVLSTELVQKPNNFQTINDSAKATKALTFLDNLEEHEDVLRVFANLDIPEGTI
ncbi:YebC/PmpR family DNA-binding transcriptional regulator [Patescibacteria group bacterium]|nr:YebC/PmpR family DNA-binding transcriptional regulator [Patescibacteria group bacterium]